MLCSYKYSTAQCNSLKGPNLLGARGTFSNKYIVANQNASICTRSGTLTYSPINNIGNILTGCTNVAASTPCSDYIYTDQQDGLAPEFRYTIIKNIGDKNGGNCIKGDWRGKDHTGDGGYFMAVNGAPSTAQSSFFYQMRRIPVCIGKTYEFSAWVINLLPGNDTVAAPNISLTVNGVVLANSGPVIATYQSQWFKIAGSFTATTNTVDLEISNATAVAIGNDLGLDDISINVCESNVEVLNAMQTYCEGTPLSINYQVTDNTQTHNWYKWQISTDGGNSYSDVSNPATAIFSGTNFTLTNNIGTVTASMDGNKYRLCVATKAIGLNNAECIFINDFTLNVGSCNTVPLKIISFTGHLIDGKSLLEWQTNNEISGNHFEILKSFDGLNFITAATLNMQGVDKNSIKIYNYKDDIININSQNIYYRLKHVDESGNILYSSIVKLSTGLVKSSFILFPNPFKNNLGVSFTAHQIAIAILKIKNSAGITVFSKIIDVAKGNNSLNLNNLSINAGIYFISIKNEGLNLNGKIQKL